MAFSAKTFTLLLCQASWPAMTLTMRPAPISVVGKGFMRHGNGAKKPIPSKFNDKTWLKLCVFSLPIEDGRQSAKIAWEL